MQGGHYIARVRVPVNQTPTTTGTKLDGSMNPDETESGLLEDPTNSGEPFSESCDNDLCRRKYNLAVCDGQWYYISDSTMI